MKIKVVSPKITQDSAEFLAKGLNADYCAVDKEDTHMNAHDCDLVFNYGSSKKFYAPGVMVINHPKGVRRAINKTTTHKFIKDKVPMPLHTEDIEVAKAWIKQGREVVVREFIKSNQSKGTTIVSTLSALLEIKNAKLFTRFIKHNNEYRVYSYKGKILSVYDKVVVGKNFKFKYQKNFVHQQLQNMVDTVHKELELDFFGLDVLSTKKGNLYLLEVNTGPILFPITCNKLVNEIKKEFNYETN